MSARVTLKDVARYAGVSVTTVSNVVRGWRYIAADTRTRVEQAIEALGYTPHPIAQGLRTGQTQALGFIVPDLGNPYFGAMVSAAEDAAQELGYTVIVFNSHDDPDREAEALRRAANRMVDGLLFAQVSGAQHDSFEQLGVPVVAVDRHSTAPDAASVTVNNQSVAFLALTHLHALGHRHIAHIAGAGDISPGDARLDGYRQFLREHQLDDERVVYCREHWDCLGGYDAMRALLSDGEPPTAVFACNDLVAIGALHAIQQAGLRVPDDISLVGVDDIDVSAYQNPPLTTIGQPLHEVARTGVELLLRLIRADEAVEDRHPVLQPHLLVRQSTARSGR